MEYKILLLSFIIPFTLNAELSSGIDTLKYEVNFDFSDPDSSINADVQFIYAPPIWDAILLRNSAEIIYLGIIPFENVDEAPDSGYGRWILPIDSGYVFCFITNEGNYVKLKIIDLYNPSSGMHVIFEWVYQDNGTRYFYDVPVSRTYKNTSWGTIKTLFK